MAEVPGRIVSVTVAFGEVARGVPLPRFLSYSGASLIRRLPPKRGWDSDPVVYNGARIDLVRDTGLPPAQAIAVDPEDEAEGVPVDGTLAWQDGGYADIYDVYLGVDPDELVLLSADQDATNFTPSANLAYETVYYWRIDSKNVHGTTTGLVWSFTTELAPPDLAPLVGQWTWPVRERLGFLTQILLSHNRTEQRIALRCDGSGNAIPTRSFTTALFVAGDDVVAEIEACLHGWLKRSWPVPLWPMAQVHTASLPAGSVAIAIDTRYADYRVGGYALIWQSDRAYELVTVASLADAALTLAGATVAGYTGPKWIMPCRIGWVTAAGSVQRYGGGALIDLTWEVEDVAAVTGYTATLEYDGLAILTSPGKFLGDSWSQSHDPDVAVLGGNTGPFVIVSNSAFNEVTQDHGWVCATPAEAWRLRQFLHAMRGRQAAFGVPTFRRDLVLTRPVGASDTSLTVAHRGLTRNMGLNDLRTYVAFRPPGASLLVRKVTGVRVVGDAEEQLDLDVSPGTAFAAGSTLCWVDRCRLASDTVEFEWTGRGECTVMTQLVRVT